LYDDYSYVPLVLRENLEKVGNPRHKKKFRERICVGSSGACRPNVPTFGCRANMSPTCRQLSQPRSDCNVHPGAGPVGESFYCCMNCTIKFHSCITCSGVQFGDWISPVLLHAASSVSTLSQCGQENFDHYKDVFSLLSWSCALTARRASL
jgi:hypothetical protein